MIGAKTRKKVKNCCYCVVTFCLILIKNGLLISWNTNALRSVHIKRHRLKSFSFNFFSVLFSISFPSFVCTQNFPNNILFFCNFGLFEGIRVRTKRGRSMCETWVDIFRQVNVFFPCLPLSSATILYTQKLG